MTTVSKRKFHHVFLSLAFICLMQVSEGLYKKLHAYVRMRLQDVYPGKIDPTGPIPSHILGTYAACILLDLTGSLKIPLMTNLTSITTC